MKTKMLVLLLLLCSTLLSQIQERANDIGEAYMRAHAIAKAFGPSAQVMGVPGTGSMMPVLDEGCFVVVNRAAPKVGDVASFSRPPRGFEAAYDCTHRIISERKGMFILKGDNNDRTDPGFFRASDYLHTVVAVVRFAEVPLKKPITLAEWRAQVGGRK